MKKEQLTSEVSTLERKILMLINEHHSLKEDVKMLREENQTLKKIVEDKDQKINNFQNTINLSKIAGSIPIEDDEAKKIKNVIERYIVEIDKCIAFLNQ